MDFLNFVSGDNLFKYTFTLGLVMLIFSIVYPVQKRQEIELERISYIKEGMILNFKLKDHRSKMSEYESEIKELDKIAFKKKYNLKYFIKIKKKIRVVIDRIDQFDSKTNDLLIENIKMQSNYRRIKFLDLQLLELDSYFFYLRISGIFFSLFGFIFWSIQTFKKPKQTTTP